MDNPLTPNKIQRLIHLAEDKSFTMSRRLLINDDDLKRLATTNQAALNRTNLTTNCSSGILDLDRMEAFGDSAIGDISLSKSTAFNPGEMTGRSTGADDIISIPLGRHSLALESLTSQMDKQTSEIQDLMRHSIATNTSFYSQRDLTADEASLVAREAPIPVQHTTQHFPDSVLLDNSNVSVGAYFRNRCPEFNRMLGKTDSPDRSYMPSITEVSDCHSNTRESMRSAKRSMLKMDQTLDCVPVRQPRNNTDNIQEIPSNIGKDSEPHSSTFLVPKAEKVNEASSSKTPENVEQFYMSQVPDKPKYVQMALNSVSPQKSAPVPVNKDTDLLIKNLHASLRLMGDETEGSMENSLSISKIADYLGKQSNVSVTGMLQYNNKKKQVNRKPPLTELHLNKPETKRINQDIQVTSLRDSQKTETSSSAGTINTVISANKYKVNVEQKVPPVAVSQHSLMDHLDEENKSKRTTRSKSPSSKSQSTMSTVQENYTSFKSGDSPLQNSKGEANSSHVASPNIVYKELDKSVDWHDVMHQKHLKQEVFAKEQWVEVSATVANGYVGADCPVTLTITTLTDSWLTAKLQFVDLPNDGRDLTIELPRMPLLLSPGKAEKITLYLTCKIEINTILNYTISLKDTSIVDGDIEQKGEIELNIKMPLIQAMSCDGLNKVTFPAIQENTALTKSFVLISDCLANLDLDLSVVEGDSIFTIKSVQEIRKTDVNKVLMDQQGCTDDDGGKAKSKAISKQLCRLTGGNAIRVTIKFKAPKLSDLQIADSIATLQGKLNVNLIGVNSVLRKVDLVGAVGFANLVVNTTSNKLMLSQEPTNLDLSNNGSIPGIWVVKFKSNCTSDNFPFKISPFKFEIVPSDSKTVSLFYTGPPDTVCEATLVFVEVTTGHKTTIEISGGADKPKTFPIKTNYTSISWVRNGRKELSLKNTTDKKIYIRCQIVGEGFAIDLPGESRGIYCVPFGPCECRPLPITFAPTSNLPHKATLHLVFDKNSDYSRKINLYGCAAVESMRWFGLVTYGDVALVKAISRMPINLEMYNNSPTAAFVCAGIHFNLQYTCLSAGASLSGACSVVRARARHALALRVDWPRLEQLRARLAAGSVSTLATVTVITGAELTRRRILKCIRNESNGKLDTSLLPDGLKVLIQKFDGEDDSTDELLEDFKENKTSLKELIGGIQELTAQIDLPKEFTGENTILITDDTVLEHFTFCD